MITSDFGDKNLENCDYYYSFNFVVSSNNTHEKIAKVYGNLDLVRL